MTVIQTTDTLILTDRQTDRHRLTLTDRQSDSQMHYTDKMVGDVARDATNFAA